jgi:hypothetical protein
MQVSNAGHMVPMDQPKNSLEMLYRWTTGKSLDSGANLAQSLPAVAVEVHNEKVKEGLKELVLDDGQQSTKELREITLEEKVDRKEQGGKFVDW